MTQVEHDANVLHTHVLDGQQGASRRTEKHVGTGLLLLVFDGELHTRVRLSHCSNALYRVVPETPVVDLEGVVKSILAGPELDIPGIKLVRHFDSPLSQFHRFVPHCRVWIGETSPLKLAHIEMRGNGLSAQSCPLQRLTDLCD